MKRRVVPIVVGLAVLLSLLVPGAPVLAEETWCEVDPLVVIATPAGNRVPVYVVNAGPAEHAPNLLLATVGSTTRPAANGTATAVTMTVLIADSDGHGHRAVSRVWSGPAQTGRLYSENAGKVGRLVRHEFTLDVP